MSKQTKRKKVYGASIRLRLSTELLGKLQKLAVEKGTTVAQLVREGLAKAVADGGVK